MKRDLQQNKVFWALMAACVVNLLIHLCLYPMLPEQIPIHWNFRGEIDNWGPKWSDLALCALPLGLLLMFRFLPSADPKAKNYEKFFGFYQAFEAVFTVFMIGISWLAPLAAFGLVAMEGGTVVLLIEGSIGVMFIFIGNYMPRVKQNYFMGVKMPGALADEHNWNRSQRMGGITFIVMGALMLLDGILSGRLWFLSMGGIFVGVIWMYLYSYLVFKGKMK